MRALGAVAAVALLAGLLAACTDGVDTDQPAPVAGGGPAAVEIADNLADRRAVAVDKLVRLDAVNGTFENVRVRAADGAVLTGKLDADRTTWTAGSRLEPGTRYVVRAATRNADGDVERRTRRFRTVELGLDRLTYASVAPLDGETVGVGMPVIVTFDVAVTDRASMERHMTVTSVPRQAGSWHWLTDNEVHWRPRSYWRAGSDVSVDLDINSVPAGDGVFGQESRRIEFHVGDSVVHKVDVGSHTMRSWINGKLARTIPVSAGKAGFETRSGTKVIIEKHRYKTMDAATTGINEGDPEYYNIEDVEYALRVTYSGEFLHAAPWSVGSQGDDNVSHGCVGMSTADAAWVYNTSKRGDVVEVTGTDRQMTLQNGFGDWNLSFSDYRSGSALR